MQCLLLILCFPIVEYSQQRENGREGGRVFDMLHAIWFPEVSRLADSDRNEMKDV